MTAPANIEKEKILELASRFWKVSEIAGFFRVSITTIYQYVTAEELQQAREVGKGNLRELGWNAAKSPTGIKILHHMLQYHMDEIPSVRGKLSEVSNEELAAEVQRRVAAAKLIQSGEWKNVLQGESSGKKLFAKVEKKQSEATGEEKIPDGNTDGEPK